MGAALSPASHLRTGLTRATREVSAGWLEGTACPWYTRPGWNGGHCGIFGQFSPVGDHEARQSGIASIFGLRYHLSKTIPKHGGHTCRIDVKPIASTTDTVQLRRSKAAP